MSHFTIENFRRMGRRCRCVPGHRLEETDPVRSGRCVHRPWLLNPFRAAGTPDWYFFWTKNHTKTS
jgi:hypothetical protein